MNSDFKFIDKNKFYLLIILVGFFIYSYSLFSPFVWDDVPQIQNNYFIQTLANAPKFFLGSTFGLINNSNATGLYYKPLLSLMFSVIFSIFGSNTFYFHFFQVLIDICNTILMFVLFKKFFKEYISFFLSLIFLVHPMNVEAVSYISALQEPLFLFFGITALILSLKEKLTNRRSFIIGFLLLCSLFSKETGFLFLIIIYAYRIFYKKGQLIKTAIFTSIPLLTYLFLRLAVAKIVTERIPEIPMMVLPISLRIFSMPEIFLFYLKTFFFPYVLIISQNWSITKPDIQFYLPLIIDLAIFFGLLFFGVWLYQNKKILFSSYLFFTLWFLIGIGFHMQILPLDMTVADRWFYFPMIGILGTFGVLSQTINVTKNGMKSFCKYVLILIVVLFSIRTIIRNADWQSGISLYSNTLKYEKNNDLIENALAVELTKAGNYSEAITHFNNLIQRNPNQPTLYYNVAIVYESEGSFDKAKSLYRKILNKDGQGAAYARLALIYLQRDHNFVETKKITEAGVKIYPENGTLWSIEAVADYELGHEQNALFEAGKAKVLMPSTQTQNIYNTIINHRPFN